MGRSKFFLWGLGLALLKHNLDRAVAGFGFHRPWYFWNYLAPPADLFSDGGSEADRTFLLVLALLAVPFACAGIVLCLRRLRDLDWPPLLSLFFFVPVLNLLFFLVLSLMPSAPSPSEEPNSKASLPFGLDRCWPRSELGCALLAIAITSIVTTVAGALGIYMLGDYGSGLFFGIPFVLGVCNSLLLGVRHNPSLGSALGVSMLSACCVFGFLLALAIEGVICLLMAAPIALPMTLLGAWIGHVVQRRLRAPAAYCQCCGVFWLSLGFVLPTEAFLRGEAPLREVRTSVHVNAPMNDVWEHVIVFSRIPEPREWIFKTGIAYPVEARLEGRGVGAIRHCLFTTGSFVEPITVWDRPRCLAFDVIAQPPPMTEMSPYHGLQPEHLDRMFISERGQFFLKRGPGGSTVLEGTTWYRHRLWPQAYWQPITGHIIHAIHWRVLLHIKAEAEAAFSQNPG